MKKEIFTTVHRLGRECADHMMNDADVEDLVASDAANWETRYEDYDWLREQLEKIGISRHDLVGSSCEMTMRQDVVDAFEAGFAERMGEVVPRSD